MFAKVKHVWEPLFFGGGDQDEASKYKKNYVPQTGSVSVLR
jgi:hypothetical protein